MFYKKFSWEIDIALKQYLKYIKLNGYKLYVNNKKSKYLSVGLSNIYVEHYLEIPLNDEDDAPIN